MARVAMRLASDWASSAAWVGAPFTSPRGVGALLAQPASTQQDTATPAHRPGNPRSSSNNKNGPRMGPIMGGG